MKAWEHDHTFDQDERKPGELRTLAVVLLTAAMMVLEIVGGIVYGSMALLADGLHMASHATALSISMVAYVYARKYARDKRFCFGTGKVNSLAGFTGAILLAVFAILMVWESAERLAEPVPIAFNQALFVAALGLFVNGISVVILGHGNAHEHSHSGDDKTQHDEHGHSHKHDHNLRSAYLHVLADALTSFLAIFALLAGKYAGLNWLDPAMGVVGAILVARWSLGLLRTTSRVLLDYQGPEYVRRAIQRGIDGSSSATIVDLHLWQVAPEKYVLVLSVVAPEPMPPDGYKRLLPRNIGLAHVTVEVHRNENSTE